MKLRERLWLWGQDPGTHHAYKDNYWKLPGVNRMDPAEGARHLGIVNCCRVVMSGKPLPPFDRESEKLKDLKRVVWSVIGDSSSTRNDGGATDLGEVIRQARSFPNVTGGILDDFFDLSGKARLSVEELKAVRRGLHEDGPRPLDLWVVYYASQLKFDCRAHLDVCDVVTFWTWVGAEIGNLDGNLATLCRQTPGKRRLAGCYLWNYGERMPLTIAQMEAQCSTYRRWIGKGDIEGVVFCSNNLADIGLETAEWTRDWIRQAGDEET